MPGNGVFFQNLDREAKFGHGEFTQGQPGAQILLILHEIGHLVSDGAGNALLPEDRGKANLSHVNTTKVEEACADEIKQVVK